MPNMVVRTVRDQLNYLISIIALSLSFDRRPSSRVFDCVSSLTKHPISLLPINFIVPGKAVEAIPRRSPRCTLMHVLWRSRPLQSGVTFRRVPLSSSFPIQHRIFHAIPRCSTRPQVSARRPECDRWSVISSNFSPFSTTNAKYCSKSASATLAKMATDRDILPSEYGIFYYVRLCKH